MGLLRSATGKVGCLPLTRKSSLEIVGCLGSSRKGPGPLAGGLNPPGAASQLTCGLGEKSGGDSALPAGEAHRSISGSSERLTATEFRAKQLVISTSPRRAMTTTITPP